VGIEKRDRVEINESSLLLLPHIFALSTNSPFGKADIPAKSFTKVFDKFQELVYQNILNQWPLTIISSRLW
jgi:gamma-glutamyl:cysteine ligase YbdK (ATP-grasp superfamily)